MAEIVRCRSESGSVTLTREGVLDCFIVPYNVPTPIVELDERERVDAYMEGFRESSFERQVQAAAKERGVAGRVLLKDGHTSDKLGQFRTLISTPKGLMGEAKVKPSKIDDVADLISEGITGLSVEFLALSRDRASGDGVRWRQRAHLQAVAIVPQGAYADATVVRMRERQEEEERREALAAIDEYVERERDRWAHLRSR